MSSSPHKVYPVHLRLANWIISNGWNAVCWYHQFISSANMTIYWQSHYLLTCCKQNCLSKKVPTIYTPIHEPHNQLQKQHEYNTLTSKAHLSVVTCNTNILQLQILTSKWCLERVCIFVVTFKQQFLWKGGEIIFSPVPLCSFLTRHITAYPKYD